MSVNNTFKPLTYASFISGKIETLRKKRSWALGLSSFDLPITDLTQISDFGPLLVSFCKGEASLFLKPDGNITFVNSLNLHTGHNDDVSEPFMSASLAAFSRKYEQDLGGQRLCFFWHAL